MHDIGPGKVFAVEGEDEKLHRAAKDLLAAAKAVLANWDKNLSEPIQELAKAVRKAEGKE